MLFSCGYIVYLLEFYVLMVDQGFHGKPNDKQNKIEYDDCDEDAQCVKELKEFYKNVGKLVYAK